MTAMLRKAMREMTTILRAIAWAGVLTIAALSLVPGPYRPHTFMPPHAEHFVAYAITSFAFGIAYRTPVARFFALAGLPLMAGLFEIAQLVIPGRNGQVSDWVASSAGTLTGIVIAVALFSLQPAGGRERG